MPARWASRGLATARCRRRPRSTGGPCRSTTRVAAAAQSGRRRGRVRSCISRRPDVRSAARGAWRSPTCSARRSTASPPTPPWARILAAQERGRASATLGRGTAPRRRRGVVGRRSREPLSTLRRAIRADAARPARPGRARVADRDRGGYRRRPRLRPTPIAASRCPREDEVATLAALRRCCRSAAPRWPAARRTGAIPWRPRSGRARACWRRRSWPDATCWWWPMPSRGGRGPAPSDHVRLSALIALVQAMNGPTRAALSLLRAGGNRSGADAVLTSQTGYPAGRRLLTRRAALSAVRRHRRRSWPRAARWTPCSWRAAWTTFRAGWRRAGRRAGRAHRAGGVGGRLGPRSVAIDTGLAGVHDAGTALRLDDVPLPVRAVVPGPPAAAAVVKAARGAVVTRQAVGKCSQRRTR